MLREVSDGIAGRYAYDPIVGSFFAQYQTEQCGFAVSVPAYQTNALCWIDSKTGFIENYLLSVCFRQVTYLKHSIYSYTHMLMLSPGRPLFALPFRFLRCPRGNSSGQA